MSYSTPSDNFSLLLNRLEQRLDENGSLLNTNDDIISNQFSSLTRLGLAQENPPAPSTPANSMAGGATQAGLPKEPTLLERFNILIKRFDQQLQATREQKSAHQFVSEALDNQFNTSVKGDAQLGMGAAPAGYGHQDVKQAGY